MPVHFEGVFSVVPTPFRSDGDVDTESLTKIVDLYLNAGVSGLTALGVTSETARLNEAERIMILQAIVEQAAGRVPVIAGASAEGTRLCIEFSKAARMAGASAVMISPPRLPKLNSDAVVCHYKEISEAFDLPLIVQDYPPVSGYHMEPSLIVRIAREVPAARTIKLEDAPTPFKTARILEKAEGLQIKILGGLGGVYLIEELMAGASGAMTGFAYPEILIEVVKLFRSQKYEEAAAVFYRHVALMRFEFQEGIGMAIRKELLRRRGALSNTALRFPAASLDQVTIDALDRLLSWLRRESSPWISA